MERTIDARGLACPLPALKTRLAAREMASGDVLVVLATDLEAPIDVAAVAGDVGCAFEARRAPGGWELRLLKP